MRRFILFSVLVLAGAHTAFAQKGNLYRYDNFDTQQGVQVEAPVVAAPKPVASARKVRLTAATPAARNPGSSMVSELSATRPRLPMTVSRSLDGYTTGNTQVDALIVESGARHSVDPVLLYAIMHRESAFKQRAISYKGARGLMQLMPATAARFGVTNIFDPRQNIDGGAKYMRWLLNRFQGDVRLALAGYNAGEGAVDKYRGIPPYNETQEYVRRISQRYALMRDPQAALKAKTLTPTAMAEMKNDTQATVPPPPAYERVVYSVRLPNGQLMLVSQ